MKSGGNNWKRGQKFSSQSINNSCFYTFVNFLCVQTSKVHSIAGYQRDFPAQTVLVWYTIDLVITPPNCDNQIMHSKQPEMKKFWISESQ